MASFTSRAAGSWVIPGSKISKLSATPAAASASSSDAASVSLDKNRKKPVVKKRSWGEWWSGQKAGESGAPKVTNTWAELDASLTKLRSATYLDDKVKQPSGEGMYVAIGMESLRSGSVPLAHAAERVAHLKSYIASFDANKDGLPEFVVVTWRMPGPPHTAVVALFRRNPKVPSTDPGFKAFREFCDGDEDTKNRLLKFIPAFVQAPVVVTGSISGLGGLRPVIIAKRIATHFYKGPKHIEISLDIGSSRVASSIRGIVVGAATKMIIDLAFTIEGQKVEHLPERVLLSQRYYHFDLDGTTLDLDANGNVASEFANDDATDESEEEEEEEEETVADGVAKLAVSDK